MRRHKVSVAETFRLEKLHVAEKKLKNGNALGPDNIPTEPLRKP